MHRRKYERYGIWFPVQISTDEFGALAISHNVGGGGMLLASAATLKHGQQVSVTFSLPPSGPERKVVGRVVRVEPNSDDPEGTWPNRVALEFEVADEELEELLRQASERISRL